MIEKNILSREALSKKQYLIISSAILQYFIAAYFFEVIPQLKHFYPPGALQYLDLIVKKIVKNKELKTMIRVSSYSSR